MASVVSMQRDSLQLRVRAMKVLEHFGRNKQAKALPCCAEKGRPGALWWVNVGEQKSRVMEITSTQRAESAGAG